MYVEIERRNAMRQVSRSLTLKNPVYQKLKKIASKKSLTVMALIRMVLSEYAEKENE
jgi:predicted DNA-binding ribbon-helix-helix protein